MKTKTTCKRINKGKIKTYKTVGKKKCFDANECLGECSHKIFEKYDPKNAAKNKNLKACVTQLGSQGGIKSFSLVFC